MVASWSCALCTFINEDLTSSCGACGSVRKCGFLKRKYWPDTASFKKRQRKRMQVRKELNELSSHPELIAEKKRIEERTAHEMKLAKEECEQDIAEIKMTDLREQQLLDRMLEHECQRVTTQYKELLERRRRNVREKFKVAYKLKNVYQDKQILVIKQTWPNLPENVEKILDELMDVSPTSLSPKKKRRWTDSNRNDYFRKHLGSQSDAILRSFCKGSLINAERVRFGLSDSEVKADFMEICPPSSPFYANLPTSYSGTRLGPLMKG